MNIHTPQATALEARHPDAAPAAKAALAAGPASANAQRPPSADDKIRALLAEHVLPPLGHLRRALHLGCAEFASLLVIGEFARSVTVLDEDAAHVARARDLAAAAGLNRLQFSCGGVDGELPAASFDVLFASHILSSAADDEALDRHLHKLIERLAPDATLLTQDWIGAEAALPALRSLPTWRAAFERAGLHCVADHAVERDADGATHRLMQWQRAAIPVPSDAPPQAAQAEPVAQSVALTAAGAVAPIPVEAPAQGAADPALVERIAEQQDRQSEVLLQIGQLLLSLGDRLQALEAPGANAAPALQPVVDRLERLESTLHWMARQPRGLSLGPIRVAFLVHHAAAWPAIRGIVDAMRAAPDFDPVIVSLPHRFPMLARMGGEQQVHDMLSQQGYAHVRITDDQAGRALERVKLLNPQVIFRQAPWDGDVPGGLQASMLGFAKLCYVPYGYLTARIEQQQFDQAYHRLCWRIFCPDEIHRDLFTQHNLQAGRNCRVTGYPKFDHLARQASGAGHWPVAQARPQAFRLIWAPHFSYEGSWLRFGVFDRMAEDMLQFVAAHRDVEVVLRPHPAMREAMEKAGADTLLGRVRERWNALPNAGWSDEEDYAGLFAASHALLTDGLSFFSEYQLFDKPLVFFEREGHTGFNAAGQKLLDGMYRVADFETCARLLRRLAQGREEAPVVQARQRIAQALRPYPDEAARRIVDVIRREIQEI